MNASSLAAFWSCVWFVLNCQIHSTIPESFPVKKSTLIATLLVNMETGFDLGHAERIVAATFRDDHPDASFLAWNGELNDEWCKNLIRSKGKLSRVNVAQAIIDFWDLH
jgi:hypothetical protein